MPEPSTKRIAKHRFMGKARRGRSFCVADDLPNCRASSCFGERLDVPKLRQECVLIVVATARHNPPLFVEVADFAERQRHLSPGRLQRTQWPVVCAFGGKPGDDNLSRVNVFRGGDSAIRESLSPCFGPLPELVRTVQVKTPGIIGVSKTLRRVADPACEVTPHPAIGPG